VVTNADLAGRLGVTPEWIYEVSGIEERRYAEAGETVVSMAEAAGRDCLSRTGTKPEEIGLLIVSSGSSERRFPGPASSIAYRLGLKETAAIDLPLASAGSLFGMALASMLASVYRKVLVVAAEKMSAVVEHDPPDRNVDILFGDGAGACLVSEGDGWARITDFLFQSDGAFAEDLKLEFGKPIDMNGRSVIVQASRKIPRAILQVLERNRVLAAEVSVFLMHQANQNLIDRVAKATGVPASKFYSNIERYGNTSSASMLIAASEWWQSTKRLGSGVPICFAAFGAGYHWGAVLAVGA
jgi:3-oxoacyl-[acyl-carrier-protein] synthase-3